jgi:hypothetical protein
MTIDTRLNLLILLFLLCSGCKEANLKAIEQLRLKGIALAVEEYHLSYDRYPNGLAALSQYDPHVRSLTVDVWNSPVRYVVSEESFIVQSAGPDRKFNTSDDLKSCKEDMEDRYGKQERKTEHP